METIDHIQCEQCGNPEADHDFESVRDVVKINRRVYREWLDPQHDEGCRIWSLEICDAQVHWDTGSAAALLLGFVACKRGHKFFVPNLGSFQRS